ncbi:MAG: hypothetical protein OXG39_19410 [Chloroflexi bacterium]|nr:hypothetical protein [Chloroflexota bacterium]
MLKVIAMALADIVVPLWIISFALFVSVGYVLTLLIPMRIENWAALLLFAIILPFCCLVARAWSKHKKGGYSGFDIAWRMFLPMAIPVIVLAPGLFIIVTSPTMQVMNHPDIHFGYIYQLMYESTPVENVFLAGFPANYYWLWHAYIAAFVKLTSLKASHVATLINVGSMLLSFLWIGQVLVRLRMAKPRTIYLGFLIIFVYASINMTGIFSLIASHIDGTYVPNDTRVLLLDGANRYLHNSLTKIININTTNVSIAAFASVLYICLRFLESELDFLSLVLISAWGIIGLACLPIVTMYIVVVLLGGVAATVCFSLLRQKNVSVYGSAGWSLLQGRISARALFAWFFVSFGLSLPLLKYVSDSAYNLHDGFGFEFMNSYNLGMINGAFVLLLPLFFLNFTVLNRKDNVLHVFVQLSGSLGLILASSFVAYYDKIQHKGLYCLTILVAISALHSLQIMRKSRVKPWRFVGGLTAIVFFVLTYSRIAYIEVFMIERARHDSIAGFEYDGSHIIHLNNRHNRYDAYYWVRDNTPSNAVIIVPLDSFMYANVLLERQLYIKREQLYYTANISAYHQRIRQLNRFYRNDTGAQDYYYISRNIARHFPDRPIYAVVKDAEVSPEVMAGRDAELLFEHQGDGANVYRLYPSTEPPQEG